MTRIRLAGTLVLAVAVSLASVPAHASGTVVVKSLSLDAWFGGNEGPGGSIGEVAFVPGPGTAPLGGGSAELRIDANGRSSFGTAAFKGTLLTAISQLKYQAYVSSVATPTSPALQFDVDYDSTDANTAYQGRLTFEPTAVPPTDTWVAQDALAGTWWASQLPGKAVCPQSSPCTWAQVLAVFPNAAVRNDPVGSGALLFRLGGPIAGGAVANVDNFSIIISGTPTTYDFEPGASVNPTVATAGTSVTIRAYGFKPNTLVRSYYYVAPRRRRRRLCNATSSATGAFICTVPLPSAPLAGPAGVHNVRVQGQRRVTYNTSILINP